MEAESNPRTTMAVEMQQALDQAVENGEIKEELYRVLSNGAKKLREFERQTEDVDEGETSKYLVATYATPKIYFRIPEDLDYAAEWSVKWGKLHYRAKTGEKKIAEPAHDHNGDESLKWADRFAWLKERPWMWNGDSDIDSDDEDFSGGILQFLQ